jgi:hypothetical protein
MTGIVADLCSVDHYALGRTDTVQICERTPNRSIRDERDPVSGAIVDLDYKLWITAEAVAQASGPVLTFISLELLPSRLPKEND